VLGLVLLYGGRLSILVFGGVVRFCIAVSRILVGMYVELLGRSRVLVIRSLFLSSEI
jgi:hypothetical protein